jgi:hypothetical protein
MAKPREETIVSLGAYTTFIETLTAKNKGTHWFRGVGDANYELIPSLYRHKTITEISQLIELEFDILTRFKLRSPKPGFRTHLGIPVFHAALQRTDASPGLE